MKTPIWKLKHYIKAYLTLSTFMIQGRPTRNFLNAVKDILPQNENFLKYFFRVMFTSKLSKTKYLRIIWKNKAVILLF